MLKRLRTKFVVINMVIVMVMLGVIFSLQYFSVSRDMERESIQMMETIARSPMEPVRPNIPYEDIRLPYFSVTLNHAGETVAVGGGYYDLSDDSVISELLQKTFDAHATRGVLKDYNLRFFRTNTPFGQCVVFTDMTSEQKTLAHMAKTYLLIGAAAFLVFLGISILLARWAVKPVESAWKQQKQFVADASHELKTPLTVIMTDAELLNSPDCSPEDRQQLSDSVLTMSAQMRGLVENLLELARIDNGNRKAAHQHCSFSEAVSETAMLFEPVFFEKGLPFRYEIEPDITVNGDVSQLKQLVEILLDNASKYASPGGETVLRLTRMQKKNRCLLEVADRGEPITSGDLKNLFKRFYRADKARAMNHSYGLGLSIAQSVCEAHHGSIRAESCDGWNRFFAEIPATK